MEAQNLWGDALFYVLPFVNLRGIPVARYQGNTTATAETEWRWDFSPRFSVVGFVGAGKAVLKEDSWGNESWKTSGGAGARNLFARKLKLRMVSTSHGGSRSGRIILCLGLLGENKGPSLSVFFTVEKADFELLIKLSAELNDLRICFVQRYKAGSGPV